jgi:hypothetical protein
MRDEPRQSGWPKEPDVELSEEPGVWKLVLLYTLPLLVLLVFPAVAWVGLLPGAVGLRWTTFPPHRRRLVALYVVAGLISVAPWIAMILRGDLAELSG